MKTAEQIITDIVDVTFMQKGFKAPRLTEAILKALKEAGYEIVYKGDEPDNKIPP